MQEFGLFDSWTRANDFAGKLNEGLGLSELESRQIVTDSAIGIAEPLSATKSSVSVWNLAPVLRAARVLQVHNVLAQLKMVLNFCATARLLGFCEQRNRIVQSTHSAFISKS